MNIYQNKAYPVDVRIDDLLSQMTLEEKCAQLTQFFGVQTYEKQGADVSVCDAFKETLSGNGIGLIYGIQRADTVAGVTLENNMTVGQGASLVNQIQQYNLEHTRLGIPLLFAEECTHGLMASGSTVYPVPLCVSSTWNDALYAQMCRAIAEEARARGVLVTYSPILESVRDIRWGRTEETYGEDVYLCTRMGLAGVGALQGDDISSDHAIAAAIKHFVVHGAPEGGLNVAYASVGERQLHEVWLEPFKRVIEAGARALITAYHEVDGIPICAHKQLIQGLVKDQWGFDDFVFSDLGAVELLASTYKVARDEKEATFLAFDAGVDIDMAGFCYNTHLVKLVKEGSIPVSHVDDSVRRILKLKFDMGLFEHPFHDVVRAVSLARNPSYKALARKVAQEGLVMLKNENNLLPLSKKQTVAVIGPNADNVYNQLGDYTSFQPKEDIVTVVDGIRNAVQGQVLYAKGCSIRSMDRSGFAEAIEAASKADVIITAMGGSSTRFASKDCIDPTTGQARIVDKEISDMESGEGVDRCELQLLGVQRELLAELKKLGKPLVVVYLSGRPISDPWVSEHADALLSTSYPGEQGGNAIADILFGDVCPSGKLTVSIPRHTGQLPLYYARHPSIQVKSGYVEMDAEGRYPFGFGLSYTTFSYQNLHITTQGKTAAVTLDVTNTGACYGQETVQLYMNKSQSRVTRPVLLKGFVKVGMKAGETQTVSMQLGYHELKLLNVDMAWVVEPGEYNVMVGASSKDIRLEGTFVL